MKYFVLAALLLCSVCFAGDTPVPKSPAATAAIAKHAKAIADADAAYKAAKLQANRELVNELKKAQADVLKAGGPASLAEGNAIQGVIDKTTALEKPAAPVDPRKPMVGKWTWPDKTLSADRAWFSLNDNQTTHAGWHDKLGVWAVREDGSCVARVSLSGEPSVIKLQPDGKTFLWPDGKTSKKIEN